MSSALSAPLRMTIVLPFIQYHEITHGVVYHTTYSQERCKELNAVTDHRSPQDRAAALAFVRCFVCTVKDWQVN